MRSPSFQKVNPKLKKELIAKQKESDERAKRDA